MRQVGRWVVIAALALVLVVTACSGGDDNKKDQGSSSGAPAATVTAATSATRTPAATGTASASSQAQTAGGDCFAGLTSYRYDGTVNLKLPGGTGQRFGDVKLSGSAVAPDRSQTKVDIGGQTFELISIGSDVWVRPGNGAWEKNPPEAANVPFKPEDICRISASDLQRSGLQSSKERVNGVDAIEYRVTKKDIEKLSGGIGGAAAALSVLADDLELSLWVTEKEQWPLRIVLVASQQGNDALSLKAEFNVTDFNKSDIKIDAPR